MVIAGVYPPSSAGSEFVQNADVTIPIRIVLHGYQNPKDYYLEDPWKDVLPPRNPDVLTTVRSLGQQRPAIDPKM